jgi:hypothetical protein
MRDWLRITPDEIVSLADGLVLGIKSSDPIDKWVDLVRMMSPDKWKELTGWARLAIDHRIAAEMLMRLRNDLEFEGVAPALGTLPTMAWTPQHDRLNPRMDDLDRILTDYGISPHPSLMLPLEGVRPAAGPGFGLEGHRTPFGGDLMPLNEPAVELMIAT